MEVEVKIPEDIGFERAKRVAQAIADSFGSSMLLSFCDRKRKVKMPDVDCCGEDSWEIYARKRGGDFKVKVNHYEFMFLVE